jgi:KaiC/GvpD/RAD55 family RecA-like ATPase
MTTSPFHDHWQEYRAEWHGVVPLPWRRKDPPAPHFTGDGADANDDRLRSVMRTYVTKVDGKLKTWHTGNIGLHLPDGVIGVDLDVYKVPGVRAALEALTGPLPPTLNSTSRVDGSGIRLYSCPPLPAGKRYRTAPVSGCEIIQRRHRYVVAWPSIHPDTAQPYRWIDERTGEVLERVPLRAELEPLPDAAWLWLLEDVATYQQRDAVEFDLTDGEPHPLVLDELEDALAALRADAGGRHDSMTVHTMALARLAERGFPGVNDAVKVYRQAFVEIVGQDRDDAAGEFDRAMDGARAKVKTTVATMPTYQEYEEAEEWQPMNGSAGSPSTTASPSTSAPDVDLLPSTRVSATTSAGDASATDPTTQAIAKRDDHRTAAWSPLDLGDVLSDDYEPLLPEVLERPDGKAMFYPKRVNMLMGESGGGKSWVALVAVGAALAAGAAAVYVDLEDHPRSITERLRALGVAPEAIRDRFYYVRPDVAAKHAEVAQVRALLADIRPAMLVIDSVGEAMALHGLKQNDDDAVAQWFTFMPREWAKETCVILIDHVPKSQDADPLQAIGSQRKKAAIDGAMYRVTQVKPMGRGLTGRLTLTTAKDRNGAHALKSKACEIEFASSEDGSVVTVAMGMPEERDDDGHVKRPTVLMERVSELLERNPGLSGHQIETTVSGKASGIRKAIAVLVSEGYVRAVPMPGRGGGFRYEVDRPFRDAEITLSPPSQPEPRPSSQPRPNLVPDELPDPKNRTSSPRPPTVRTEGRGTRFGGMESAKEPEPRPLEEAATEDPEPTPDPAPWVDPCPF